MPKTLDMTRILREQKEQLRAGFQDRLVMTASITLRVKYDVAFDGVPRPCGGVPCPSQRLSCRARLFYHTCHGLSSTIRKNNRSPGVKIISDPIPSENSVENRQRSAENRQKIAFSYGQAAVFML